MEISDIKKKLHTLLLNLLIELNEQCDEAGVEYYAVGGTLLGAVRHKGFIPWDDDMDVMIFKKDYDRLISHLENNLGNEYCIVTRENSPLYFQEYPKLCYKGTSGEPSEVCIDIFVYTPTDVRKKLLRSFQNFMLKYLYMVKRYKVRRIKGQDAAISSAINRMFIKVSSVIPMRWIDKMFQSVVGAGSKSGREYVTDWGSPYSYKKATFKTKLFAPAKKLMFEGIDISVPAEYDKYLTQLFGDYMELPPVEKRVNHGTDLKNCETVDLSKAEKRISEYTNKVKD